MDEMTELDETSTPAPVTRPPAPSAPAPASSSPPAVPGPTLMEQRAENRKRWDAARDRWQPGDPTTDIELLARSDLDFKNQMEARGEGTQLSDDPLEAAAGLLSPEEPDAAVFAQRLAPLGLTEEGKPFATTVGNFFGREMHAEAEALMRDVDGLKDDAAATPWTHERAVLALDPSTVAFWSFAWDQLSARERAAIDARGQRFHPPTIERIAQTMERYVASAKGRRWWENGGRAEFDRRVRVATEDRRSWQGDDE